MKKAKISEEARSLLFITIFTLLLLSSPYLIRHFTTENNLITDQPYYHARIAETISFPSVPDTDELSFGGRQYILNPYHLLLSPFVHVFGDYIPSVMIPILLGVISAYLFYLSMKNLGFNRKNTFLSTLFLVISPVFLNIFIISGRFTFLFFLYICGFFFLMQKKKHLTLFAIIPFSIIPLFGLIHSMILITAILSYLVYSKHFRLYSIFMIIPVFATLVYQPKAYSNFGSTAIGLLQTNYLSQTFADLGAELGYSIFTSLLAIIGFILFWKNKKKFYIPYAYFLILLVLSFFLGDTINIYLAPFIAIFASLGFLKLLTMKWTLKLIKALTVLLLTVGLVLSVGSYMARLVNSPPDDALINGLEWLSLNSEPGSIVFSHYSYGLFIESISGLPAYTDSMIMYSPEPEHRFNRSEEIFYSTSIRTTTTILSEENIKYLVFDKNLRRILQLSDDEGIFFLFRNNETFKNIYSTDGLGIWKVIQGEKNR